MQKACLKRKLKNVRCAELPFTSFGITVILITFSTSVQKGSYSGYMKLNSTVFKIKKRIEIRSILPEQEAS
jgi:hypothetical protein